MTGYNEPRRDRDDGPIADGEYRVIEDREWSTERPPQEPPRQHSGNGFQKSAGLGLGAMLLLLLSKGKSLLFALKYTKFLGTAVSMFVMIWSYAVFYGWRYAAGIVLMIAIHEFGHYITAKAVGMPVSAPVFIPFVGALITMKVPPKDAWQEAIVALGGPFFGLVAGLCALYWGIVNHSGLVQAIAYFSFFITLFNMIPVSPLDGGRIVTALSPWVWVVGLIVMAVAAWYTFSPLMILILFFGIYRARQTWSQRHDPRQQRYFTVSAPKRWLIGIAYGLITALSGVGVYLFTGA